MTRAKTLTIADGLKLPLDAVTTATGIVGQRGTGKTSTAVVLVEEAARVGAPFVVVDPTGAWYGLRSSADGKGPGLDVVVLGGYNGDLPLAHEAGEHVARLVVTTDLSVVLDLERMTKGQQIRFVTEFAETLYHLNRTVRLVVIDEAHRYAPQSAGASERGGYGARCLGAVSDVVTLGRRKGLGAVLVSQRPAKIHKDVFEQAEIMFAHRLMGPNDRKALAGWMEEAHVGQDGPGLDALPTLTTGQAIVWAPAFDFLGRVQVRQKRTFDSSATPEVGARVVAPQARASVDLAAIEQQLGAAIEQAKAEDPAALKQRVADLERRLAEAPNPDDVAAAWASQESALADRNLSRSELDDIAEILGCDADASGRHGEVLARARLVSAITARPSGLSDATRAELRVGYQHAEERAEAAQRVVAEAVAALERLADVLQTKAGVEVIDGQPVELDDGPTTAHPDARSAPLPAALAQTTGHKATPRSAPQAPSAAPEAPRSRAPANGDAPDLVAGARRMLDALGRYGPLTRKELSTLGNSFGGSMRTNLSTLKTAGLVEEDDGRVRLTAQGARRAPHFGPWSPEEVIAMHESKLVAGARRILGVVMRGGANGGFTRSELERLADSRGGSFRTNLSKLRTLGLVEERNRRVYPGHVLYYDQIEERRR